MKTHTHKHIQSILTSQNDLAFIVGNGINRYGRASSKPDNRSWGVLLRSLWGEYNPGVRFPSSIVEGDNADVTLPELYDVMRLLTNDQGKVPSESQIRAYITEELGMWTHGPHHVRFVEHARRTETPILTTNYDLLLANSWPDIYYYRPQAPDKSFRFDHAYPWTSYYSDRELQSPLDGFGIWHMHGTIQHPKSIRISLSHYVKSVAKAESYTRPMIGASLYSNKSAKRGWHGQQTWLEILFSKRLFIIGLGLDTDEMFLRSLLIERAKFLRSEGGALKMNTGWYIHTRRTSNCCAGKPMTSSKRLFLKAVGLEVIELETTEELYEASW